LQCLLRYAPGDASVPLFLEPFSPSTRSSPGEGSCSTRKHPRTRTKIPHSPVRILREQEESGAVEDGSPTVEQDPVGVESPPAFEPIFTERAANSGEYGKPEENESTADPEPAPAAELCGPEHGPYRC
jgi:hypothetical protein